MSHKYISSPLFALIDQQDNFIVINKIAGVNFHDEDELGQGLFNQVKTQLNLNELYPVHRLDKMTSGIVIMAKNLATAQQFQQLFSEHQIEKYYLALSDKKPKKKQGLIKGDMTKSRRGSYKLLHSQKKPAITQFFSYSMGDGQRLYLLKPHSGKTHQIRVALNSIGAPILGDNRYSGNKAERGYLHAYAIKFTLAEQQYSYLCLPTEGSLFLSEKGVSTLTAISSPWQLNWPKI
ncbi:MAG: TIGR01621 family pseudouridine synthase [Alteromonadaceae bacterium]|nr:TIGR01621 family pseudouridine synthase [Alteromonadaceae bacterium]